jgi:hypothetical protein
MALTLATITGKLVDQAGAPQVMAALTLTLDRPDVDPVDGYLLPLAQVFKTDGGGVVTAQVWPNDRGSEGSHYRVTADTAAGVRLFSGVMTVPTAGGALFDLLNLGFVGPPDNVAPDNAREARLVSDVADLLHEVPPSAETERKVKRWVQLVLEDAAMGRRWWFLEHLSQGAIGAGEDVIDLRGDLDHVVALYCPTRLDNVPLAVIAEQRSWAARRNLPNAGWPTQYALEGGRRVHLWPAPQEAMPFAIHYTRPMSVELPPPGWDSILVNGVLGLFGQHFDRDALTQHPEYFEARYREQLKRARLEHHDVERLPLWLRHDARQRVASSSQSSAAVARTMPASLLGIGHVCIYDLGVV